MKIPLSIMPEWAKYILQRAMKVSKALAYHGNARYCPVCGKSSSHFKDYGIGPRENAQCVHCGALERDRLVWLFLQKQSDIFDGNPKKMLHIAPEPCFELIFKERLGSNYLTADLYSNSAMVKMDVCDIQYPDSSFDIIYCSHVLEHVIDDKKAMGEIYRVLKSDGWAILNVPISSEKTFEDSSIVDPKERLKIFGQEDHVRCYGPDYVDRLHNSGFTVKIIKVNDLANSDEAVKMGLTKAGGEIFYCTK